MRKGNRFDKIFGQPKNIKQKGMTKIKNFGQPKNIKQKGIRTIKRIAFESILMRWISLEPIIQSEVSQKEKDLYHILTHIGNLGRWY